MTDFLVGLAMGILGSIYIWFVLSTTIPQEVPAQPTPQSETR